MKKKDVIKKLAEVNGLSLSTAEDVLNDFLDIVIKETHETGCFKLNGFGKFNLKTSKERVARNPKTGQTLVAPAKKRLTFTPASNVKIYINS